MINELVDALCMTLHTEFGDDYKIYTEEVVQGLKTPCFFINVLEQYQNFFRGAKYEQTNHLCIQYITDENCKNPKQECAFVQSRLFDVLEYITLDDNSVVRGTNMHTEYDDGILSFFVNYDMFVKKETGGIEKMNLVEQNMEVCP